MSVDGLRRACVRMVGWMTRPADPGPRRVPSARLLRDARPAVLVVLASLAFGVAAAPAHAGGAQAPAGVVAKGKKALKALKTSTKDALKAALLDLAAFEAGAAADHDVDELVDQLATDLDTFSQTLDDAVQTLRVDFGTAVETALDTLGADDGVYPVGLYAGAGGLVDDVFAGAQQIVDKALLKLRKRLEKTSAKFKKLRDHGLVVRVPAPEVRELAIGPGVIADPSTPMRITVLVSVSDLAASGDGRLHVRGSGGTGLDVALALFDAQVFVVDDDTQTPDENGDFAFLLTDVDEGNYLASLLEVEGTRRWDGIIGVR